MRGRNAEGVEWIGVGFGAAAATALQVSTRSKWRANCQQWFKALAVAATAAVGFLPFIFYTYFFNS